MKNLDYLNLDFDHSVSDIKDYFKHIMQKHQELTDNSPITYIKKIEHRFTVKIKTGYYVLPIKITGNFK